MARPKIFTLTLLSLAAASPAAGQSRDPEPRYYRFVSDIGYGAGLWVNPASAGFNPVTRLLGSWTFDRPEGGSWGTAQYMIGLQWKMFGFSYQHDEFAGAELSNAQGDAYTLVVGVARGRNGFGVSRTWRTVGEAKGSWELGWTSFASSGISVGLMWRDIGSPQVRGTVLRERLVGAVSFRPKDTQLAASLQGDYQTDGGDFRAFRVGGSAGLLQNLRALALAEWNGDGDFEGFRIGLVLGRPKMVASAGAGLNAGGDARTANLGLAVDGPAQR